MKPHLRQLVLAGVMVVLLAGGAAKGLHYMMTQRGRARQAADALASCRDLARDIRALRDKPAVASAEAMGIQELGRRIETACRQAGFEGAALEGVFPQSARRVGESPYLLKPTALALRGVTLPQLVTFLHHLTNGSGLDVRDIRLQTPHGDAPPSVWDAEATVTYLMYAPVKKAGPRS
ncbi:MAG: hypothetical protein R6X20_15830 [Phycisphaerae bacterium]